MLPGVLGPLSRPLRDLGPNPGRPGLTGAPATLACRFRSSREAETTRYVRRVKRRAVLLRRATCLPLMPRAENGDGHDTAVCLTNSLRYPWNLFGTFRLYRVSMGNNR